MKNSPRRLLTMAALGLLLCVPGEAGAATYLNCGASEPVINGNSNTLWCDDFEDGDMLLNNAGVSDSVNDGYVHTPYGWGASHFPDAGGHGFGRCGAATGVALVVGGTPGAAGTNCAASTGDTMDGSAEGQVPSMSDHGLSSFIEQGQDLYFRYYKKCVTGGGCTWSNNTKEAPTVNRAVGWGGIDFTNAGSLQSCPGGLPGGCFLARHEVGVKSEVVGGNERLLRQQGINDGSCSAGHTCWEDGTKVNHWYYFEHHFKLNTTGAANGEYDLWMDDCGATGTAGGCGTGGTLRSHYTDVQWLQSNGATPSGATHIGSLWLEQYSSGGTGAYVLTGQWYWDQIIASRVRVGPMKMGAAADKMAPASPKGFIWK